MMGEAAFIKPLQRERDRYEHGPICGLCSHSTFTQEELDATHPFAKSPGDMHEIADQTIRFELCRPAGKNVVASSWCHRFTRRRPTSAPHSD